MSSRPPREEGNRMANGPQWFAPKRYGFGSGFPISWQGWAVLAGYVALLAGCAQFLERKPLAAGSLIAVAMIALVMIAARTTRGGWRWRWGSRI